MIFGIREKETVIGRFESSKCVKCKKSSEYDLLKTTRYLVLFFINLIPLSSRFETVCTECGERESMDKKAASEAFEKYFPGKRFKMLAVTAAKLLAFAAVIAAAVILPLTLIKQGSPEPEMLKSLVGEDGTYSIEDMQGNMLASVVVSDGKKTLSYYDRVSELVGEPGADGSFLLHEYYNETENGLERDADDPGELDDKYGTPVRIYHLNSDGTLGYSRGIADLSKIEYTADKAVYPFVLYQSDTLKENYKIVLFDGSDKRVIVAFVPTTSGGDTDQLVSIDIRELLGGKTIKEAIYFLDDATISAAKSAGLTAQSGRQDILDFISANGLEPITTMEFEYYADTKVVTRETVTSPNSAGIMQTDTQQYDVTVKNGYYIRQVHQGD